MSVVKDAYSRVLTNVFSNKKSNLLRKLYKYKAETKLISQKGSQMAFLASLRDSYFTIFQPDPRIPECHSLLLGLISDKIRESDSLGHAPISNLTATYLALNASQLVGLRHKAQHMAIDPYLCYIIRAQLPSVATTSFKWVSLLSMPLPSNAQ